MYTVLRWSTEVAAGNGDVAKWLSVLLFGSGKIQYLKWSGQRTLHTLLHVLIVKYDYFGSSLLRMLQIALKLEHTGAHCAIN